MKPALLFFVLIFSSTASFSPPPVETKWITYRQRDYILLFTKIDRKNKKIYAKLVDNGIRFTNSFFSHPFTSKFEVFIHPDRNSLDSTWRKDWNMPDFRSECWMVASGVASKLDMLSPRQWLLEACEHNYSDTRKTQQLITHELVHVYHGQINPSHDFSDVEGIDWFVEGLATYASGQCDLPWLETINEAIGRNEIPGTLDSFWTGKFRYGLSGSVVMYLDHNYGRNKIKELMALTKRSEIYSNLGVDEAGLLAGWRNFMQNRQFER